ncbi:MAG: ABC-F family ATP-binding cassette domain-containing protein [Acidobacteria bacterium]|nr:ABC-F family ATP-binding cassette domain-containing protein [Acidobacteriota bacterium]
MAVLLTANSLTKSFGTRVLFRGVSLTVSDGERMGLIGPNGAGKTTLMRVLAGLDTPDEGEVAARKLTRVGYVPQEPEFDAQATVAEVLACEDTARFQVTLGKAGFRDPAARAGELSGGWRKRLAIARELVAAPDLLLLDEPTNHLDLEGIQWLEKLLKAGPFASIFVSHDRYFLESVSTRLGELNRVYPEGVFVVPGNYSEFLARREDFLAAQQKLEESLANKVDREIEWLRRGPKARTTKSRARIDQAGRLMAELAAVAARNASSTAQIDFTATDRKTKRLIACEGIAARAGGRTLFENLNLTLSPGLCLGLVGPNGSGKTTLLRLLNEELAPSAGVVTRADNLRVVYFEQNRESLDPGVSLRRSLAPEADLVVYRDRPVHVAGWAKRFLFSAEQIEVPVGQLSGGERARVLIARLMLQPADVLLLDEPTNDLDIPTLEVLEESLADFPGALVLVTHDRYLLDRLATVVVGLDGEGGAGVFADYPQWEAWLAERARARSASRERPAESRPAAAAKKKLSYIEQREWDGIEERILEAESALEAVEREMHAPEVVSDGPRLQDCCARLQAAQAEADRLYSRWAELESRLV